MEQLLNKIVVEICGNVGDDRLTFKCNDGSILSFYHTQDCCESVRIEDITGDLQDLIGDPILMSEESASKYEAEKDYYDSGTWTFYKFATMKGSVTVRWLGISNGYYSESVDWSWDNSGMLA